MKADNPLIKVCNCYVLKDGCPVTSLFTWEMKKGEVWLVTGPNGGGKSHFIEALGTDNAGASLSGCTFEPQTGGLYFNKYKSSTSVVSLEAAASLIKEERLNDESDYIEGGIDIGRTARDFIQEVLPSDNRKNLEQFEEVVLCGISTVLDRGLKYLSTGEIRRVLLCRALLSKCQFLILSDPFAGLDSVSRKILNSFFSSMAIKNVGVNFDFVPSILLCMERYAEIPRGITNVLEFSGGGISFCGKICDYEDLMQKRKEENSQKIINEKITETRIFQELHAESKIFLKKSKDENKNELVSMKNVTVAWGGNTVLNKLTWTLYAGEHWLIRGPNGSGKTTFLELITGDNMQVFCNDVSVFGRRRGTGETIWELKEKMGIVSYRLHLEYRMLGGTDLEAVLLSGFHDSIGLYEQRSQVEQMAVRKWLTFGGFDGRGHENFGSLSYGEQRAVLILRAVVKCPLLLILDEPCHGLDEEYRARILNLLEEIAKTGTTTMLHVTHDPTEVLSCEKHVLELCPGENPMYRIIMR